MTRYLRWHAWSIYEWKPELAPVPEKPEDFGGIVWQYLPKIAEPMLFIRDRINGLNNERIRVLRPIMERLGMLSALPKPNASPASTSKSLRRWRP